MKFHHLVLCAALAGCLWACAAIGALLGGGIGLAGGPATAVGGAVIGAEVGDLVGGKKAADAEIKDLREEVVDLRATITANRQIDTYNASGKKAVPHVEPRPATESTWLRYFLIAFVCLVGVGAAWVFRARLRAWAQRIPDLIRGRAPSAPKDPAPTPTPLNPEP